MKHKKQKGTIFVTFVICIACISLLGAALGTDYWIVSNPRREVEQIGVEINSITVTSSPGVKQNEKFRGSLNIGLFNGHKLFDSGFGTLGRAEEINGKMVLTTVN